MKEPLLVQDHLLAGLPKMFVRIVICWTLGCVFGAVNILSYYLADDVTLTDKLTPHVSYALFWFILTVAMGPAVKTVNALSGSKQRSLAKSIEAHFRNIKTKHRKSSQTITQFRSKFTRNLRQIYRIRLSHTKIDSTVFYKFK